MATTPNADATPVGDALAAAARAVEAARKGAGRPAVEEVGVLEEVAEAVVRVSGLSTAKEEELLRLPDGSLGLAFQLEADRIGVLVLDREFDAAAGARVHRTGTVATVPVGEALLGRVVDGIGRPLDGGGPLESERRMPVERDAPPILDRAPVSEPLQTGWKVVDALIPVGRGQRELVLGDRQTGKTALAVDAILNQRGDDVLSVYCAVGQRASAVARVIQTLREHDALSRTIVVVATGDDPPGLQYLAPFAATTMAEAFMEDGRDVLIVYDDVTRHARAYRELSLLLRRPPGREAYPGDIFYLHARLLERATHLKEERGGGSLTALPIVETQAGNLSAYIPTNLVSITDGQIYLSPDLFQKGLLPAVEVGRSVSRVGGKAQRPVYEAVSGPLRLAYSQFEELEDFARFGTRLEEDTRRKLVRGRRVRRILAQGEHEPRTPLEQVVVLLAAAEGVLDEVESDAVPDAEAALLDRLDALPEDLRRPFEEHAPIEDDERDALVAWARDALEAREREA